MEYQEFLKSKEIKVVESGFDVRELNELLFPFQKYIVRRALKAGRFAIWADCGLGKTAMQLEWSKRVSIHTGKPVLILCPLAVSGQTIREGGKFDVEVYKQGLEINKGGRLQSYQIDIANYEQLKNIDVSVYSGIVLDESSILKNFTGKTKVLLIESFKDTPYKLCCSATPAPNDLNEIGNHSEFLDVLDAQDMRSKWFVREEGMSNYRLKAHAKKHFYAWVSSWAVMLTKPSDIGFEMPGYNLPDLEIVEFEVQVPLRPKEGELYNEDSVNATGYHAELQATQRERLAKVAEIVNGSTENFVIWIKEDAEGIALRKLIPDAIEVRGPDKPEVKEKNLLAFAENKFRVLITKGKIAMFGMNWQNCHNTVFASPDFSFELVYQCIRRFLRFGQLNKVIAWFITTPTMANIGRIFQKKQKQFLEMQNEMNQNINADRYGLLNSYKYKEIRNDYMWLMKGDSCIEIDRIEDNSLGFGIWSPPFSSLFTYSNYIHDMGNNETHGDFFKQYGYLLKKIYNKLMPGRLVACHTKNLAIYKGSSGYTGVYDFTKDHTEAMLQAGFKVHCQITIWTDPVLERARTNTQRLLHKQVTSDSSYSGVGLAEYITVFRKWEGDEKDWVPVNELNKQNFPIPTWQEWASPVYKENLLNYEKPDLISAILSMKAEIFMLKYGCNPNLPAHWYDDVWMDIKRTDVLNGKEGYAQGDEKHIAPLQLEVIKRCVKMWSNAGETVYTPFGGIGSEPYVSIKEKRKAIASELKDSYFEVMVKNCKNAVAVVNVPTLFDLEPAA